MAQYRDKAASKPRTAEGLWSAEVTRVTGADVYVKVSALTDEFEHGPIIYDGTPPGVGDDALVGFLGGDQDTVVAVFSGGAGGGGDTEVTWLIASSEASPAVKAIADFVCDGVDDDEEIREAVQNHSGGYMSIIYFTGGIYNLSGPIDGSSSVKFIGSGTEETIFQFIDVGTPGEARVMGGYYYFLMQDLSIWWYFNIDAEEIEDYATPPAALITCNYAIIKRVNIELYNWGAYEPSIADSHNNTAAINSPYAKVTDCRIESDGKGFISGGTQNVVIKGNTIISENSAIDFTGYAYYGLITNNMISTGDAADFAVYVYYGYSSTFSYNHISGYERIGVRMRGYRMNVSSNYFTGGNSTNWEGMDGGEPDSTIWIDSSGYSTVKNNVMVGTSGLGIYAGNYDSYYDVISNNQILYPYAEAITLVNPRYVIVADNTIYDQSWASAIHATGGVDLQIRNNSIHKADPGYTPTILVDNTDVFTVSGNMVHDGSLMINSAKEA